MSTIKKILSIVLLLTMTTPLMIPTMQGYPEDQRGPRLDVWQAEVITSPDAELIAMQNEEGHVLTDLIRTPDIEKMRSDGFTVVGDLGFHMGHIGYNIRPDQSYRREDDVSFWVLSDVKFREALFHSYDQARIVDTIYGYISRAVQSLVPPAQGNWSNPNVPVYDFNLNGVGNDDPGDPIPGDLSDLTAATTILINAGYEYHGTGIGDAAAYWTYPDTELVRPDTSDRKIQHLILWTPTYEVAPTSADHGRFFVDDLGRIGLRASADNGWSGFEHVPYEFSAYLDMVFGDPLATPPIPGAQFDAYMVFWSLGRFPDHIYDMTHSDFDCQAFPGRYNAPGIMDDDLDDLTEIVRYGLDHDEKNDACWEAQMRLYDASYSYALAYMQLYSRTYWNSFNPDLEGAVRSPGYGADNGYTYVNLRWKEGSEKTLTDGRTYVNWIWGEFPESFNTMHATTVYAVDLISKTQDGLMDINPFTLADMYAMGTDSDVVETPGGPGAMNVTFTLRDDVYWQDGTPYTAWDAKWNWEFLRDNQIPRYTSVWKTIQDVDVHNDTCVTIVSNETSQFLVYDWAGSAALMPPVVWRLVDGEALATIMQFAPEQNTTKPVWASGIAGYPTDFAKEAGSWFGDAVQGHPQTQLYGTGPWAFVSYTGGVAQFERSTTYYETTASIETRLADMFHAIGDVGGSPFSPWNEPDGVIDVWDMSYLTFNYGFPYYIPPADPDSRTSPGYRDYLDINNDYVVDIGDASSASYYQGNQKEYP